MTVSLGKKRKIFLEKTVKKVENKVDSISGLEVSHESNQPASTSQIST